MCVLVFCTASVWNISHCKKNWARYYHKCTYSYIGLHVQCLIYCTSIGLHVQCRYTVHLSVCMYSADILYIYRSACTVPLYCTCIGLHVQCRYDVHLSVCMYSADILYIYRSACTVPLYCTSIGLLVQYRYTVHLSVCVYSTGCYCHIAMKLECYRQIFEKYSNMKSRENLSSGSRVVTCGWTDGRSNRETDRHEDTSRFSQFCERP